MTVQPSNILCVTDPPLTEPVQHVAWHEFPLVSPFHVFGVVSEVKSLSLVVTTHIDRRCVSSLLNIVSLIYD